MTDLEAAQLLTSVRAGMPVLDRRGVVVGRVAEVYEADPLLASVDGRRSGQADDISARLPAGSCRATGDNRALVQ